jgi:hypothetical protein
MAEVIINTTYSRSISFTRAQLKKIQRADEVLVKDKYTGRPIARLKASSVSSGAKQIWVEDKHGNMRLSVFFVYAF